MANLDMNTQRIESKHTAGGVPFLQGQSVAIGSECSAWAERSYHGQELNKEAGMMHAGEETIL